MRTRLWSLAVSAMLIVAACTANPPPSPSPQPTGTPAAPTDTPAATPGATATPAGPTSTPAPPTATPEPTQYPEGVEYVITVRLKPGIMWSDGTSLTAADFVGTYDLFWAQQDPAWNVLVDIVQLDELTFQYQLSDLSQRDLWLLVRWNVPGATSQFGEFFQRARDLRTSGVAQDDERVTQLMTEVDAFTPENAATYGPFRFDPASITEAQMELVKNPGGFNADAVDFDRVIVYWGDTQQAVPLILSNQLDYTTSALSPADERAVLGNDHLRIIRGPLGVGPAVWFNQNTSPFDQVQFRQAVAHLLDRAQIATVSLGQSAVPIEHMAGFSDNLVDQWLTPETTAALNQYEHNLDRATQLLNEIGWNKVGDRWQDANGQPVSYELTVPTDFVDFLATGQEVAQQLTTFGIPTTVRGIAAADRPATIQQADYQMLIDFNQISTPSHPAASMTYYMTEGFFGSNSPDSAEGEPKGYNWPLTQTAPDGSQVNIRELLAQSESGLDIEAQKAPVQTLTLIFNQQLPIVPIYERYTNEPINVVDRAVGWLPPEDPIYLNNQGSDNYVSQQLVSGQLSVAPGGDGTFRTNAPYAQPPNFSFNAFNYATGLMWTLTSPTYEALYPPLFWGSVADGTYVNTGIGESWTLEQVGP